MSRARFAAALLSASVAVSRRRAAEGPARPSWSWSFEVFATALKRRAREIARLDPSGQRAAWAALSGPSPAVRKVAREDVAIGELRGAVFTPREGERASSVVLYLHGGSYIYGSIDTHVDVLARIALATSGAVVAFEYRLAPEHPFPAALDDALAAWDWLIGARGVAPARVVIAGDSAGGGLAAAMLPLLRDRGGPLPAGAVLISPWVDLAARGGTIESNAPYDYAEPEDFVRWAEIYLAGAPAEDPRASPTYADLSRLPPMLVLLGGAEMLRDQVIEFGSRARAAGTDVDLEIDPDMIHDGPVFAMVFARCCAAYERIGAFVRARTR